jgi:hypothetical protein
MRKSVNFFLGILFWGARNDHFQSWAAIYLKFLVSTLLDVKHCASPNDHPESTGPVERLHRRLKDTLCACAAAATWVNELPFVLLGLRAQLREDTGLSPPRLNLFLELQLSSQMNFWNLINPLLILY